MRDSATTLRIPDSEQEHIANSTCEASKRDMRVPVTFTWVFSSVLKTNQNRHLRSSVRAFCVIICVGPKAALLLAPWIGQRQGDLLRLTANYRDPAYIRMRQSKPVAARGLCRVTISTGPPRRPMMLGRTRERTRGLSSRGGYSILDLNGYQPALNQAEPRRADAMAVIS